MIAVAMSSYRRMTEDQYRAERAEIDATYGKTAGDRHGLYDQALASLFARSEWTQEELAKEEGKSRPWAVRHLLFGRFLANVPTGTKPKNLTEWRFRNYWERTDPSERNERIRFSAVEKLMAADTTVSKNCAPKRSLGKAIVAQFGDGAWHYESTIVAHVEASLEDVRAVLDGMRRMGTYHTLCERRKGGKEFQYRLVRGHGRQVDVDVFLQQVSPIVRELEREGRKHVAECSPGTIAMIAHKLKTAIEQLTHQAAVTPKKKKSTAKES